jgi:hypothetical protein
LDLLGPQGDGTGTDPENEDWLIDPFRPTYSTVDWHGPYSYYGYDYYYAYYRAAAYPPIDAPSGTPDNPILIDVPAGEWAYIWFQYRNEPANPTIRGYFEATDGTGAPATDLEFTYYLQNDFDNPDDPGRGPRWEGDATPPEYPEWRGNPQLLDVWLWAYGLRNGPDNPRNMFHRQSGGGDVYTGVGLVGAISGQPADTVYEYCMTLWDYYPTSYGVPEQGEHAFFKFVPEPAALTSVLVLSLAALRPRR